MNKRLEKVLEDGRVLVSSTNSQAKIKSFNASVKYWEILNKYSNVKIPEKYKNKEETFEETFIKLNKEHGSKNNKL